MQNVASGQTFVVKIWKPYTGPAAELLTWSKKMLKAEDDEGEEKQLIILLR